MFKGFDWGLLVLIILISCLGMMILYSVAPDFAKQHLIHFGLGLAFFFFFANFDYRIFQGLSLINYIFSIIFLFSTFLLGRFTRGTLRWLTIGSFTLQPSELIKPFFILAFAGLACQKPPKKGKNLFLLFFLFLALGFLIFYQPALGSFLVALVSWLAIVFAAGISVWYLLAGLVVVFLSFPAGWRFLADYQKARIIAFLNPGQNPLGSGYHLIQSKIAVGSGRIFGKGLGQGTQSHLRFLPEFQSDFIFSALAEELGLIGSLMLIILFFLLLWHLLKTAQKTNDQFGFLVVIGITTMLAFQIFVNIGMNIGLLPITGITLPLVSAGGSSLIATMISLGLTANIFKVEKKKF